MGQPLPAIEPGCAYRDLFERELTALAPVDFASNSGTQSKTMESRGRPVPGFALSSDYPA
ncbi:hypothetical protein [Streptomyces sp. NPDC003480]